MSCHRPESTPVASPAGAGRDYNSLAVMQPRAPAATPKEMKNGAPVKANNVAPQGVYLPNYNILTPHMRSPEYVQMSTAAAITLGVVQGKMYRCACTRCLNLLLTLSGRLPGELRVLRTRAPPRGGARLRRPQLHPRRLAGRAARHGDRHRRARRRSEPVPSHVHLDDHASAVGPGHGERAEAMDRAHRPFDDPGVDPVEPHDDDARGRRAAARAGRRHLHRCAGRGDA